MNEPNERTPRAWMLAALIAVAPAVAQAQTPPREAHALMADHPWFDVAWVGGATAMLLTGTLVIRANEAQVAPLDGGGHRDVNASAATASDLVAAAGVTLPVVGAALIERYALGAPRWEWLRAPLILGESALMASGLVAMVKNLGGVCRPRAWNDVTRRCDAATLEDHLSFPSAHTAPIAAMAGASLGLWLLPSRAQRVWAPLLIGTAALAATNLVLRVVAGAHSWVDTGTGFVVGFATGFGTAALHTRQGAAWQVAVRPDGVVVVGGVF